MSTVAEPVAKAVAAGRMIASPRLAFRDPAKAIGFYQRTLGAKETFRFQVGDSILHAEIMIGDSVIDITGEWPEGGRFSAETLGGSPISMSVQVDDVDAFAEHAVSAGMKLVREPKDQFYGHRDAMLQDPFGYSWAVFTVKEEMSVEEMHRRMKGMTTGPQGGQMPSESKGVSPVPAGYRMVTPYLVAQDANAVIDFVKKTFAGEEVFRAVGSAGGYHCEVRVEDSMLMIGGGGAGVAWKGEPMLGAFHVYVRDCDAAYRRALSRRRASRSLSPPISSMVSARGSVIDSAGNHLGTSRPLRRAATSRRCSAGKIIPQKVAARSSCSTNSIAYVETPSSDASCATTRAESWVPCLLLTETDRANQELTTESNGSAVLIEFRGLHRHRKGTLPPIFPG